VKDIVRQLYGNLFRLRGGRTSGTSADLRELFPPVEVLTDAQVERLATTLGVSIETPALYEQALTHRSYLQVLDSPDHRSNERLEFLGDAILGMITAEYLFYDNKQTLEGQLTKMRSWLVNKNSLAICARALNLESFLFLSYSAQQSLDKGNDGMLADALEAVIAAVYLDQGFDASRRFIIDKLLPIMVQEVLLRHDTRSSRK
jgi:ribonuclease III